VVYVDPGAAKGGSTTDAQAEIRRLREELERLQKLLKDKDRKEDKREERKQEDRAREPAAPAKLTIKLPAEAVMYVDGVKCPLTSGSRSFATNPLEPGRKYYYTIRADLDRNGTLLTQSQKVVVESGRQVTVEFDSLAPVATTSQR
jgi:uncharacterized protein (TIGR03000 family)